MRGMMLCLAVATACTGCAPKNTGIWKLLPTETAQVDFVGIVPLPKPSGTTVAHLNGELEGIRKYEIALPQDDLDRELRRLLDANRQARLTVRAGVLVLIPPAGERITLGAGAPRPAATAATGGDGSGVAALVQSVR